MRRSGRRLSIVVLGLFLTLLAALGLFCLSGLVIWLGPDAWFEGAFVHWRSGSGGTILTPDTRLSIGVVAIATSLMMIAIVWPLVGVVRDTVRGAPFSTANILRLRVLAGAFLLAVLARRFFFALVEALPPQAKLLFPELADPGGIKVSFVITALILFVLAEVFREGALLREDVEATV